MSVSEQGEARGPAIEDWYLEERRFPPARSSSAGRSSPTPPCTTRRRGTGRGSGPGRPSPSTGTRSGTRSASGSSRSPSGSSAGSSTPAPTASTATSMPGRGDRVAYHWEGEPGDTRTITYAELARRGRPVRQRAEGPRGADRRPGQHLHADDPRAAGGDAGVRPDRRRPLGRVRRLLRRRAPGPDQRRRGEGPRHRRRRLAARRPPCR